jgi:hypothetical protein
MQLTPLFLVIGVLIVGYPQQAGSVLLTLVALRLIFRR